MKYPIDLQPRLSEKSYALSNNRVYVVGVDSSVNKQTLKQAVEEQFKVKVLNVNMTITKGKPKRTISAKGRRLARGRNADLKKAYITLAEGNSLPFFAAIEEEEKQAEKVQTELAKQQEKDAKAESKPKRRTLRAKKQPPKEES
jgi:large subunit ribosomal protein L23